MTPNVPVTLLSDAISKIVEEFILAAPACPVYLFTLPYYLEYRVCVLLATLNTAPGKAALLR